MAGRKRSHPDFGQRGIDRKSTRLNSSHGYISYAVFCLKKKKERRNIGDRRCTHLDASKYHDIETAMKLGIKAVWLNRPGAHHEHDDSNVTSSDGRCIT